MSSEAKAEAPRTGGVRENRYRPRELYKSVRRPGGRGESARLPVVVSGGGPARTGDGAAARVRAGRRGRCACLSAGVRARSSVGRASSRAPRVFSCLSVAAHEAGARGGGSAGGGSGGGGRAGGLQPGGRPAADRAGARAAAAVRPQQHARRQLLHAGQEPVGGGRARDGLERGGRAAQVVAHPQLVLASPAQRAAWRVHEPRPAGVALVPGRRAGLPARPHGHRHAPLLLCALAARGGHGRAQRRRCQAVHAVVAVVRAGAGAGAPALAGRLALQLFGVRLRRDVAVLPVLPRHLPRLPRAAGAAPAPVQAPLPGPAARPARRGGSAVRGAACRGGRRGGVGHGGARPLPPWRRPSRGQAPRVPPPRHLMSALGDDCLI